MTRVSSREGSSLYVLGTEEIHREPRTLVTETIQSPPALGEGNSDRDRVLPHLAGPGSISGEDRQWLRHRRQSTLIVSCVSHSKVPPWPRR